VKAGFKERCSCRNATSNPFLERTIRPKSYQRGLWILAIPLFQWSLKGSKLISILRSAQGLLHTALDLVGKYSGPDKQQIVDSLNQALQDSKKSGKIISQITHQKTKLASPNSTRHNLLYGAPAVLENRSDCLDGSFSAIVAEESIVSDTHQS
jgi:hypothetical protein